MDPATLQIVHLVAAAAIGWAARHFGLVGPSAPATPAQPAGPGAPHPILTEIKSLLMALLSQGVAQPAPAGGGMLPVPGSVVSGPHIFVPEQVVPLGTGSRPGA